MTEITDDQAKAFCWLMDWIDRDHDGFIAQHLESSLRMHNSGAIDPRALPGTLKLINDLRALHCQLQER